MSNILENVLNIARVNHSRCCNITEILWNRLFCLFCLFGVFRPTREFFTHMETSPLPVKGCRDRGLNPDLPHTRQTYGIVTVSNKYQNVKKSDMAMLSQLSLD